MFSEAPRPGDIPNQEISTADIKVSTTLASTSSDNAVQQVQITTFQDVEQPAVAITPMAQNTTSIAHFDTTFNIKEFLQRPVKLEHFQLSVGSKYKLNEFTTTDFQQPVRSYKLPEDVLKKGGKMDKVRNHQYFKADVKVKLVLNTSPFVAGRFYLTYSPYEDTISDARQQKWASRAGVTAYPGVEIDAQLDNSVEITIPFASYKESYVLTNYAEPFATLNLFSIVPIRGTTAGKGHIDIAVYAWFENIELNIPTSKVIDAPNSLDECAIPPMIMQRADIGRKVERLKKDNPTIYNYILSTLGITDKVKGSMQMDSTTSKFKKPLSESEYIRINSQISQQQQTRDEYRQRVYGRMQVQAEAGSGPISSIASTVGSIADVVSGIPIPVVSEIATTVGWISDLVGNVASIFGWSKPNSMKEVLALQNVPGKNFTHYDGIDQSVSLSLSNRNELDKLNNIFPSAADEMSLSYICANPAIVHIKEWKSSAAAGEIFTSTPLILLPVGISSFSAQELGSAVQFNSIPTVFTVDNIYDKCVPELANWNQYKIPYTAYNRSNNASGQCGIYPTEVRAKGTTSKFLLSTAPCEYTSQLFKYWRATICFKISVVKTAFHTGRLEIFFDPGMYNSIKDNRFIQPDLSSYTNIDTSNNYKYILDLTNDTEITIKIPFVSEQLFLSTQGLNAGQKLPSMESVANSIIGSLIIRPLTNLMCPETVMESVDIIVWKWAEDVVLTCPIATGSSSLSIYDRDQQFIPPNIETGDIDYKILQNLKVDGKDMECVEGKMQINIGNKAEGNTITFFNTINIEEENMRACKNAAGERLVSFRPLLRVFRFFKKFNSLDIILNPQEDDDKQNPDYISYLSYMFRFFRGGFRYKIIHDGNQCESTLVEDGNDTTTLAPSHITFPKLNPMHEISIPYYSKFRKLPISSTTGIMQARVRGDGKKTTILRSGNDDLTFGWLMGTPQLTPGGGTITWLSLEKVSNVTSQDGCIDYPNSIPNSAEWQQKTAAKIAKVGNLRKIRETGDIIFPNSGESFLASLNEG